MKEVRSQTEREELANWISHGVALLLAVVAIPVLIVASVKAGSVSAIVGASVFSLTILLLYLASSVYHAVPERHGRVKKFCQLLDHSAIYLLIAGTYTPFTLEVLRGRLGWALFGVVWGLALLGILLKSTGTFRSEKLSVALYVVMGWLVVIAIKPLWLAMTGWGFFWLVAGGAAYTLGVIFYAADSVKYAHFVWHLFVMAGTACHVAAVFSTMVVES